MTDNPFARLLTWLRGGYPHGVPQSDYVALYGILHRDLTETEVTEIAVALRRSRGVPEDEISRDQIADQIRRSALERPSEEDVARVAGRLAAGGWPLATASAPVEPAASAGDVTSPDKAPTRDADNPTPSGA